MKKLLAVAMIVLAATVCPAAAEVKSLHVCEAKTLSASTTTDCTIGAVYPDISTYKYFSFQMSCAETDGTTMSVSADWVGGSASGSAYVGIPILVSGSAMSQLKTAWTTESTWTTLQSIHPPVSPVGTIRLTENNGDDDIVCTVILNMGN